MSEEVGVASPGGVVQMDKLSSEVSSKITRAIKAKLMELGAYVDDELPQYIMVIN